MRSIVAIAFWLLAATSAAVADVPKPDETGMVPGDLLLGNSDTFPGHTGVYVGKWEALPKSLRDTYADVHFDMLIRSRDQGLKHSFLALDSDGGRGVRLVSFAEQFTGYLPKSGRVNLRGLYVFESGKGGAVEWGGLPTSDQRRWSIIEEGLKAARARVPYDDTHWQLETVANPAYDVLQEWVGVVEKLRSDKIPYDQMPALDCTAFVHIIYWRGAQIDLDVSWLPIHLPGDLFESIGETNRARKVNFKPVALDTLVTGGWSVDAKGTDAKGKVTKLEDLPIWLQIDDGRIFHASIGPTFDAPMGELTPVLGTLQHGNDDVFFEQREPKQFLRVEIDTPFELKGYVEGYDDDGDYRWDISAEKRRDYRN